MFKQFIISDFNSVDLKIEFCGYHRCEKNHSYGPSVRDIYLAHFCLNGKGVLCDKYGRHNVSKGEFFIIRPNEMTTYTADKTEPWEYVWVAFSGTNANIFNNEISVYPFARLTSRREIQPIQIPSGTVPLPSRVSFSSDSQARKIYPPAVHHSGRVNSLIPLSAKA